MPSIRKRAGKTGVTWQVRYEADTPSGYAYQPCATRAECVAFIRTLGLSGQGASSDLTVYDVLRNWLETVEKVGRNGREPVAAITLRKYREFANNHLVPLIGDESAHLDAPRADRLRRELLERCNRPTARRCLASIKMAFNEAVTRGDVPTNPFAAIKIADSSRAAGRIEIPTRAEMSRIEAAFRHFRDHPDLRVSDDWARTYAMLLTLRWTGCRPNECRALAVEDVLWDRGVIRILHGADEHCGIGAPKTASGRRVVNMPEPLARALADWIVIRGDQKGLLFPTAAGKPVSLANLTNRGWYPVLKHASLEGRFGLYSLRHFRISERLAAGEDVLRVSQQSGHTNGGFTLKVYGHVVQEGMP